MNNKNFITLIDVRILLAFSFSYYVGREIYFDTAFDADSKSGELPSAWGKNRDIPLRRDEVDPEISSMHAPCTLHHGATFFFELDGSWLRGFVTFQMFRKLSLDGRG